MNKRKVVVETQLPIDEVEKRWTDNVKYKKFNYRWFLDRVWDRNNAIGHFEVISETNGKFWLDCNDKKSDSILVATDPFRHVFRGTVTVVKDVDSKKVLFEGKISQHIIEKILIALVFVIFAISGFWELYEGWWLESLFTFMFAFFVLAVFQWSGQHYNKLDNDMLKFLTEMLDGEVMEYHKQIGSFEWEDLGRKKTE